MSNTQRRVAVVLSGCGVFDGSEIHEAVAVFYHLSRLGASVQCFAPDKAQMHVVDHLRGKPSEGETRNVLVESARIARGNIKPLEGLNAADFDAVVFPGGFGAAKNLCDFAVKGEAMGVDPGVERVVKAFSGAGKPIGMCCIAPVIGAKVLKGSTVTIGDDQATAGAIRSWGSTNVVKPVTQAATDERHRLFTAPAYMYGDAPIHQVFEGIGQMIEGVVASIRR